jgi:DNA repair exonuclease SbcCD nuclease subunit
MAEPARIPDFTFVHAADLHLDTPFKGIGVASESVAARLREASFGAFDSLVNLCLERSASFLVIAGDLYDGPERGLRAQLHLRDGLARLSQAGIASFVVHGNHDPVETGWSALGGPWPEGVTIFGAGTVKAVPVVVDGTTVATLQGVSFAKRAERENLALGFSHSAGPGIQVGLLHCNVGGAASGYDDYSPCTLEDLGRIGLDYWALGHIHSEMILSGGAGLGEPWVVYSGCLQSRSAKPSERGPKGAVVVQVRNGKVAEVESVACDVIRFDLVEIDITDLADLAELRDVMASTARDALSAADGRSLVLDGQLVGRSGLHLDLAHRGAAQELLDTLRNDFSDTDPFCWWNGIEDKSRPVLDIDAARQGSDFAADLITLADELRASVTRDPTALSTLVDELSDGLPARVRNARTLDKMFASETSGVDELIERALLLALDELDSGSY